MLLVVSLRVRGKIAIKERRVKKPRWIRNLCKVESVSTRTNKGDFSSKRKMQPRWRINLCKVESVSTRTNERILAPKEIYDECEH